MESYEHRTANKLANETFFDADGALRWNENPTAVIAPSVFKDAMMPMPRNQRAAYERYLDASLGEYRQAQENYAPSDEELFEMRAAFGTGRDVVNVITGRRIRL